MPLSFGLNAAVSQGATATSVPLTIPAVAAGDLVVIVGCGGAAGTISIASTGTALTIIGTLQSLASSMHGAWQFIASGTDAGKVITLSTTGALQKMGLALASYPGALSAAPVDQFATHTDNALAVSTHVCPNVTTVTDQDWVLQALTGKDSTTTSWTVPGTQRAAAIGSGTGQVSVIITDGNGPVAAGAVGGGGSFVSGQGITGAGFVEWTFALSPAAVPPLLPQQLARRTPASRPTSRPAARPFAVYSR